MVAMVGPAGQLLGKTVPHPATVPSSGALEDLQTAGGVGGAGANGPGGSGGYLPGSHGN